MNASIAKQLYTDSWYNNFTNLEMLYDKIRLLADNGVRETTIYFDNQDEIDEIRSILSDKGYVIEIYNNQPEKRILIISWDHS